MTQLEKLYNSEEFGIYALVNPLLPLQVEFDLENWYGIKSTLDDYTPATAKVLGLHTTPNGTQFVGFSAGGDWEIPVYFIVYEDNSELKIHIPHEGNIFNKELMCAYGSEADTAAYYELSGEDQERVEEEGQDIIEADPDPDEEALLKSVYTFLDSKEQTHD